MKDVYSCFIVDDEPAAHMVLKSYIAKESNLQLVAQCFNVLELTAYLKHNTAALLFLDIHMPEINGIEFLELHPNPPKTILTTAYSEYALESYNYDVVDYLLKPISYPFSASCKSFFVITQPNRIV
ncbi:LytR/AlgR family response regulator transcription factor [Flavobacterium agricola]|uniref:LytR/AlgR family response regulator transcription factor n=1 Tax=Flavobacterium agricola TaxID=2870839 RepID=UPI0022237902|nr:response regulator [Flavobacterium agricola]